MAAKIRFAAPRDAAAIQAIYAPLCESTAIPFEIRPPTVEEMAGRMERIAPRYPWLVCDLNDQVAGYVYACAHRERGAYRWAVDVTAYVEPATYRRGVGPGLNASRIAMLREQEYDRAFAGITLPNPGSVRLHEAIGFRPVAVYQKVGFQQGQWRNVGWWQLNLVTDDAEPAEPRPIGDLGDTPAIRAAITLGERLLRI